MSPKLQQISYELVISCVCLTSQTTDGWGDPKCTSVIVTAGKASEDLRYLKSVALHLHLFGYELPGNLPAVKRTSCQAAEGHMALLRPGLTLQACLCMVMTHAQQMISIWKHVEHTHDPETHSIAGLRPLTPSTPVEECDLLWLSRRHLHYSAVRALKLSGCTSCC